MHTPPRKNANKKCDITKLAKCQNWNVENPTPSNAETNHRSST
jgi:hypothetical protein